MPHNEDKQKKNIMAKAADSKNDTKNTNQHAQSWAVPVNWITTVLHSSCSNFCNANSTREGAVLNFGVNKNWERGPQGSLEIELNHRIVLSPFSAKRFTDLLQQLMNEYESRYVALPEK